jgi:hypothetical protein
LTKERSWIVVRPAAMAPVSVQPSNSTDALLIP